MVAALAGVSTATVSLVTNGKTAGRVSARNIAKVEEAIAELGYVVDAIGSTLAKGQSNIVILVAPDVSNPFFAEVISGARESLGDQFQLLVSVTDAGTTPRPAQVRRLFALRPAGFLVTAPSADFLAELNSDSPIVLLDAVGADSHVPAINFDVAKGSRELAAHLAELGHRKVAYFGALTDTETFRVRSAEFTTAAKSLGMEVFSDLIQRSTVNVEAAAAAFAAALPDLKNAAISAVACCTDVHAYGVMREARAHKTSVPDELAVTGFDDLPYSASINPPLTTVHLPAKELGRMAGERLRWLMEGGSGAAPNITLPGSLVVRGSTAANNAGK